MNSDNLIQYKGVSTASLGSSYHAAKFRNGGEFIILQGEHNTKTNYYLDLFIYHLEDILIDLKISGNPLNNILELGAGRGILSVGIALLTPNETKIVGVDIQEEVLDIIKKNARLNSVDAKIEVRQGDLFSPIHDSEKFDLIVFDLPLIPVDPVKYKVQLSSNNSEFININGGPDGRYFIKKVILQAHRYLTSNGVLLFTQPSFTNINYTMDLLANNNFRGSVVASKDKLLEETQFTMENRKYIETTCGYVFQNNLEGRPIFSINILKGEFCSHDET